MRVLCVLANLFAVVKNRMLICHYRCYVAEIMILVVVALGLRSAPRGVRVRKQNQVRKQHRQDDNARVSYQRAGDGQALTLTSSSCRHVRQCYRADRVSRAQKSVT